MRKRQLTYGAMAALALALGLTSCQNELAELTPSGGERITLSVTQDDAAATRTYLNDNKKVVWSTGDALSLFDTKNINQVFELTKGAGSTTADFGGTVSVDSRKEYYAVYPYDADYIFSSGTVAGITLPAEQTAVANGFDKSAAIMTGYTTDAKNLAFKQLCAFVQITTESATKKIVFKTNGTESLAGTLSVSINEEGIGTATVASNGTGTVTLVPAGNEESIAAGTYLIAVLPGTLEQGFTMECIGTDGSELTRSYNDSTSVLNRKAVINMGTASEEQGWTPTVNGHGYVDLGIRMNGKKILFATCNVGASSPEEYGDYFAWGETEPKDVYNWSTYKWCNGSYKTLTKYCTNSSYGYNGFVDNKTELDPKDDAAYVNWGENWRMPTYDQLEELRTECTWTWTTQNGVNGRLVIGPNGNSFFLPAAGYRYDSSLDDVGSDGGYWSRTLDSRRPYYAYYLYFDSRNVVWDDLYRYYGHAVRAVRVP